MNTVERASMASRPPKAWVEKIYLELPPPRIGANQADVDRLISSLAAQTGYKNIRAPYRLWKKIPSILRKKDFRITATLVLQGDAVGLADVQSGNTERQLAGVAVDLGTTTILISLLDLKTGEILEEITIKNPQAAHGADVLSRIQYANTAEGLESLQKLVVEALNEAIGGLLLKRSLKPEWVFAAAVAGNTIMTHLFLGLDPQNIRREPYIPVVNKPNFVRARDLGLALNESAPVFVFPNVGSYFGGDLVAGILSSGLYKQPEPSILVDIGTNAEVVLGNRDWLLACAGAAGPALEGGVARMGAQAGQGVIDHISIDDRTLRARYTVIGGGKPVAMCGSAIIDLTAELFLRGIIDTQGKFVPERGAPLTDTEDGPAYVVAGGSETEHGDDISLSQIDLDVLLRSKAAMYTILQTITEEVGVSFQDLKRFYVAGTFGTYIDPRKAVILGMTPDLPLETYQPLGNSSAQGARMILLDRGLLEDVSRIRDMLTYMELNVNQKFMNLFSAARFIPHTERALFPSVKTDAELKFDESE